MANSPSSHWQTGEELPWVTSPNVPSSSVCHFTSVHWVLNHVLHRQKGYGSEKGMLMRLPQCESLGSVINQPHGSFIHFLTHNPYNKILYNEFLKTQYVDITNLLHNI